MSTRLLAVLAVAAVALVGCDGSNSSSSAPSAPKASTSAPSPESSNPSTPESTESTTVAAPLAVFATPSAAGQALFAAWTTSDRESAGLLSLAAPGELDKLFFAPPLPQAKNRGCDSGEFGSASCFFGNDQGGVNIGLVPADGGWSVDLIDPFA